MKELIEMYSAELQAALLADNHEEAVLVVNAFLVDSQLINLERDHALKGMAKNEYSGNVLSYFA